MSYIRIVKIVFCLLTGFLTFAIGISPKLLGRTFAQPGSSSDEDIPSGLEYRSCQVKQVRPDGRVVWTHCDHWLKAHEEERSIPKY